MALFRIEHEGQGLVPFAQYAAGDGLYEREVEDLLWDNLEEVLGRTLFRVARQAHLPHGGIPDILALDETGRIVVIEVKRDVDRQLLSQALEYAGWARESNLQEIATLYTNGAQQFWADWQEFTGTEQPVPISPNPHIVLAAASFHRRTEAAIGFLRGAGVPLVVLSVGMYQDADGQKFLDADRRGELGPPTATSVGTTETGNDGGSAKRSFPATLADLLNAGLLREGETLTWRRPQSGQTFTVTVERDGRLRLPDGRYASSLSAAATLCVGHGSYPGWECWRTQDGELLYTLRDQFLSPDVDPSATLDE